MKDFVAYGLRAGARLCVVSRRNIINKKFLYDCRSGVKDDRVKMLKVRNKLTVIANLLKTARWHLWHLVIDCTHCPLKGVESGQKCYV